MKKIDKSNAQKEHIKECKIEEHTRVKKWVTESVQKYTYVFYYIILSH